MRARLLERRKGGYSEKNFSSQRPSRPSFEMPRQVKPPRLEEGRGAMLRARFLSRFGGCGLSPRAKKEWQVERICWGPGNGSFRGPVGASRGVGTTMQREARGSDDGSWESLSKQTAIWGQSTKHIKSSSPPAAQKWGR